MSATKTIILSATTLKPWQKEKHEEIALQTSGHAAEFLRPDGKGTFYKYPLPKLSQITRGLHVALFGSIQTRNATANIATEMLNPADFAADMLGPPDELEIVSEQLFSSIIKGQTRAYQEINSKNVALADYKPFIWTLMEKGVPISYMNTIKGKSSYTASYENSDVEWFLKTIVEVVLTEQSGIPDEDYELASNRLNCKQGDNESLANYYKITKPLWTYVRNPMKCLPSLSSSIGEIHPSSHTHFELFEFS